MSQQRNRLVVVGHGMVGHRVVEAAIERGLTSRWDIAVLAEEPRPAYDRVRLSSYFDLADAAELSLLPGGGYDDPAVEVWLSCPVAGVDRARRVVLTQHGDVVEYDALVLATGSVPFVPPLPGRDAANCFVYRTIEDLDAIRAAAAGSRSGVVIGGGLLGLEAADALLRLGLETHVVEMAPRLIPLQVDDAGGAAKGTIIAEGAIVVDGPAVFLWGLILLIALGGLLLFAERQLEGGVSAFAGQAAALPGTEAEREASTRGLDTPRSSR